MSPRIRLVEGTCGACGQRAIADDRSWYHIRTPCRAWCSADFIPNPEPDERQAAHDSGVVIALDHMRRSSAAIRNADYPEGA